MDFNRLKRFLFLWVNIIAGVTSSKNCDQYGNEQSAGDCTCDDCGQNQICIDIDATEVSCADCPLGFSSIDGSCQTDNQGATGSAKTTTGDCDQYGNEQSASDCTCGQSTNSVNCVKDQYCIIDETECSDCPKGFIVSCSDCPRGSSLINGNCQTDNQGATGSAETYSNEQSASGNTCEQWLGSTINTATCQCGYNTCEYPDYQYCLESYTEPLSLPQATCLNCPVGSIYTGSSCNQCPLGFVFNRSFLCEECPKGSYSDEKGAIGACKVCPGGTYAESTQTTACKNCAQGTFLSVGSDAPSHDSPNKCKSCVPGTYGRTPGATSCVACESAKTPGATSCEGCPPGTIKKIINTTTFNCTICALGSYSSQQNSDSCTTCPKGYFADDQNETDHCDGCQRGEFGTVEGAVSQNQSCTKCVKGGFSDDEGLEQCKNCPKGRYGDEAGLSKESLCKNCEAGKYGSGRTGDYASTSCKNCLTGRYNKNVGESHSSKCKQCPQGYQQDILGEAFCLPCVPGKFSDEKGSSSCKNCVKNTFSHEIKQKNCSHCPIGWTADSGSARCMVCVAGRYGKSASTVDEHCEKCPLGFARSGNDSDATQCRQCPLGKTSAVEGAASCSRCDLGTYGSSNGNCSKCPAGQYQDGRGEKSCKECDPDTYLAEPGKASKADCIKCNDDRSTGTLTGNTNESACRCKRTLYYQHENECMDCPQGANCSQHDGMRMSELFALNGHWRVNLSSKVFANCSVVYSSTDATKIANERCCPASVNCTSVRNKSLSWDANTQCLTGYQGVLCGECAPNYVRRGENCDWCPGGWQIDGAVGSLLASCAVVSLISFVFVKRTKTLDKHDHHDMLEVISAQFKIFTSWLQILSVLTKTFNGVPWGASFTAYSQSSGIVVNLDLSFLSSLATCSLSLPFLEQYGLSTLYPIVVTLAIKLGQSVAMVGVKSDNRRLAQAAMGDKIFLLFIMLLFPSIANKSFTVFRCRNIPGLDFQVLDEDFSVRCWEAHHNMYVIIACISIGVYAVGVPLYLFIELYRHRNHFYAAADGSYSDKHDWAYQRLGAMFTQYEPQFWFWEIGNLVFKLCITGVLCIVAQGSPFQVILALIVCMINANLLLRFAPYDSNLADALAIVCAVCLSMTVLGGYVLMANETMQTVDPLYMDMGLIALNMVPFVIFAFNIVQLKAGSITKVGLIGRCMNNGWFATKASSAPRSTAVVPVETGADGSLKDIKSTQGWN